LANLSQHLVVTTVGGALALLGGGLNSTTGAGEYSARVDICNSTSGTWSMATLSEAWGSLAVTTVGDIALFGGGRNNTFNSARVDVYNSSSVTWSTKTLSEAQESLAATTVGDLALFGGGLNSAGGYSARVDIYNSTSGTWSTAMLSQAWKFPVATTVGDLALFGGGESLSAGGVSARVDLFYPSIPLVTPIIKDIIDTFLSPSKSHSSGNNANITLSLNNIILILSSSRPRCPDIKPSPQPFFWLV